MSLATIVGGRTVQVVQGHGPTPWSMGAGAWMYEYAKAFCFVGHPGYDLGGKVGDPLYSPVSGRVTVAGGTSYYTDIRYGARAGTGQLTITLDNGHVLILGHMQRITVRVGQRVTPGMHVGEMGTNNGAHVHVEYRIPDNTCSAGQRIVDPARFLTGDLHVPPATPTTPQPMPGDGGYWPSQPGGGTGGTWGGSRPSRAYSNDFAGLVRRIADAEAFTPYGGSFGPYLVDNARAILVRATVIALGAIMLREAIGRGV